MVMCHEWSLFLDVVNCEYIVALNVEMKKRSLQFRGWKWVVFKGLYFASPQILLVLFNLTDRVSQTGLEKTTNVAPLYLLYCLFIGFETASSKRDVFSSKIFSYTSSSLNAAAKKADYSQITSKSTSSMKKTKMIPKVGAMQRHLVTIITWYLHFINPF